MVPPSIDVPDVFPADIDGTVGLRHSIEFGRIMAEKGNNRLAAGREGSPHRQFMREALLEGERALEMGEVPVGAVLVRNGEIVARGHNLTGERGDPTEHAEMIVLRKGHRLFGPRLTECSLYVTLEPCPMCAGAIVIARLDSLYFGAYDAKGGGAGTLYSITDDRRLNHRTRTWGGLLDRQATDLLQTYFRARRQP